MTSEGFEISSFRDFQDLDFPKSKNLENKTVTFKSKADTVFFAFFSSVSCQNMGYLSGIPGPLVIQGISERFYLPMP